MLNSWLWWGFEGGRGWREKKKKKEKASRSGRGREEVEKKEKKKTQACFLLLSSSLFLYLFRSHGDLRGLLLGLLPDEPDHLVDLALDLF